MAIMVYNTLKRKKEEFKTGEAGKVRMYVCGPTTYNFIHLGNARPIVVFDTIRRYLEYKGYGVTFIQNFTDIDDKIIRRAAEEGEEAVRLSRKYIEEYYQDARALGVRPANVHPKVSEHMVEIIEMVQTLVNKGHAYELDGDVYFDVYSFKEYGKLSGRSLDDLQAGARVEVDERKKNPLDFALWKAAKAGEPAWDSPWGKGRPGWHIECSAMSVKYLGSCFDIHGGGYDLIFPHHENEIAQSEAATGAPFARYWLHNGFITVNQEKMSKSLGNFFLVREILEKYSGDVIRFFLLSTHYRSPLDFDNHKLEEHRKGLERIKNTVRSLREALERARDLESDAAAEEFRVRLRQYKESFEAAMDDDFNTALAIGVLFDLCREVNSFIKELGVVKSSKTALQEAWDLLRAMAEEVLGVVSTKDADEKGFSIESEGLLNGLLDLLLEVRRQARAKKDWATSDYIRDKLKTMGIMIEDTPDGTRWKR